MITYTTATAYYYLFLLPMLILLIITTAIADHTHRGALSGTLTVGVVRLKTPAPLFSLTQ